MVKICHLQVEINITHAPLLAYHQCWMYNHIRSLKPGFIFSRLLFQINECCFVLCLCILVLKEEEGDEVVSTATALSSHRFPPGAYSQNYSSRYADNTYSGPFLRDAHEENPESILDDHVQRVMKTPGCQSPGTGRHSPKSRSPDGFPGGKWTGLGVAQGKHPSRHGVKGDASHLYHHKHVHHIHHAGVGKPKEQVEAEAAMRVHGSIPWSMETSHYGSKCRSYADGMGSNPMEHTGYRYAPNSSSSCLLFKYPNCFLLFVLDSFFSSIIQQQRWHTV